MKKTTNHIFLSLLAVSFSLPLHCQTLKASIDRDNIVIGEQIKLKLVAEDLSHWKILHWAHLADTFNHFEVVERNQVDSSVRSNRFEQVFIITSFDSGRWYIPKWSFVFRNAITDSVVSIETQLLAVTVIPADISGVKGLHDIKDIIITPPLKNSSYNSLIILLLVIVILTIGIGVLLKKRRIRQRKKSIDTEEIRDPLQWVLEQLALLEKKDMSVRGALKDYHHQLYHICRKYFSIAFNKNVLHCTTDEWVSLLNSLNPDKELKESFNSLLKKADTVRFAEEKNNGESESEIGSVKSLVEALNRIRSAELQKK